MKRVLFLIAILSLMMLPYPAFAAEDTTLPSGLSAKQAEKNVDQIMEQYIGEEIPGAQIAIVQDGKVLLEKGYGSSNIENDKAVDPQKTVFEAGSISKVYTWTAVMQLVEAGKLDLHKDIRTYLPDDYLDLNFPEKVTMLDLMNHTAGFEDRSDRILTRDADDVIPLHDFVSKEYTQPEQIFKPGAMTSYSNYGASLAGYIVERVSGQAFVDYMQEHVLEKLDMKHASFAPDYTDIPQIADFKGKSYVKKGESFEAIDQVYVNDAPAGGLNTTVSDMTHFMLAQLDSGDYNLFEQPDTLDKMHEATYKVHDDVPGNAHGFWERYVNEHRVLEHSGNVVGYTSQLSLVPKENFGMALLMNVGGEHSGLRVDLIRDLIGKQKQPDQVSSHVNDQKVSGTYRVAQSASTSFMKLMPVISNADITISESEQGGITVESAMDPPTHYTQTKPRLYERTDDTVSMMEKSGMDTSHIAFDFDEDGNASKMTYGIISDYQPVPARDRADVNLGIILISVLTFALFAIVLMIRWLIRKRKNIEKTNHFLTSGLLSSVGLLIVANNIILFVRYATDPFQKLSALDIHVWINWLFPVALIVSAYFMFKQFKQSRRIVNSTRIALISVSCLFTLFLWNFHLLF